PVVASYSCACPQSATSPVKHTRSTGPSCNRILRLSSHASPKTRQRRQDSSSRGPRSCRSERWRMRNRHPEEVSGLTAPSPYSPLEEQFGIIRCPRAWSIGNTKPLFTRAHPPAPSSSDHPAPLGATPAVQGNGASFILVRQEVAYQVGMHT